MGKEDTLVIPLLVLSSLVLIPSVWLTCKTVQQVMRVVLPYHKSASVKKVMSVEPSTDVSTETIQTQRQISLTNSIHTNRSKKDRSHLNLYFTAISSVCYTLSLFGILIRESLILDRVSDDWGNEKRVKKIVDDSISNQIWYAVYFLVFFTANLTLALVAFLRLEGTFAATKYRLSERTVKVCKMVIIFSSVTSLTAVPFSLAGEHLISLMIAIPGWILYPFFFLWIVYRFMSTTHTIAKQMVITRQSVSIDESTVRKSQDLLDASLRLTILAVLATISTVVVMIWTVVHTAADSSLRSLWLSSIFDVLCNVYCLHCTFAENIWYYLTFLGWLHRWLLRILLKMQK